MMAEGFATIDVAEVNFYSRQRHRSNGISQGNASVGIGTRVNQNALLLSQSSVDSVNERTFVVGLEGCDLNLKRSGFQLQGTVDIDQRLYTVDTRFSFAQKIQVWAMQYQNIQHKMLSKDLTACYILFTVIPAAPAVMPLQQLTGLAQR